MPDDGLSADHNMYHTCKGTVWIKMNLCCVRLSKCSLFSNKHSVLASIKIT